MYGRLHCIVELNGKLLVSIGREVRLYEWTPDNKLSYVCCYLTHGIPISLKIKGDFILVSDMIRSMILIVYKPMEGCFEEIAKHDKPISKLLTDIAFLDYEQFLGADKNIYFFVKRYREEILYLQEIGHFDLGDIVSVFRKGSLVLQHSGERTTFYTGSVLFGTVNGAIRHHHFDRRYTTGWTRWTDWDCPVTCGGGTARRIRQCIDRKSGCEGPSLETKPCAQTSCPEGTPPELLKKANRQIEMDSRSYQLQKGDTVTLDCQGFLRSHIRSYYKNAKPYWHQNERNVVPDERRLGIMQDTMNLVIVGALPEDNGVWSCEVQLSKNAPLITSVYTLAVENDEPDLEVTEGDSITLPCKAEELSKFFRAKMTIQWYHNTQLYKQFRDANPVDFSELVIDESSPVYDGTWVCKVVEQDIDLQRASKAWTTNVVRVKILESRSSDAQTESGRNRKSPITLMVIAVSIIVLLIIVAGLYYIFRIRKKSKDKSQDDTERGESVKKSKQKKIFRDKDKRQANNKTLKKKAVKAKRKGGSNKSKNKGKGKSHGRRKIFDSDEDFLSDSSAE